MGQKFFKKKLKLVKSGFFGQDPNFFSSNIQQGSSEPKILKFVERGKLVHRLNNGLKGREGQRKQRRQTGIAGGRK